MTPKPSEVAGREMTLKDCPFCGDQGFLKSYPPRPGTAGERWYIECRSDFNCGASTMVKDSESQAIAAWNKRAALEVKADAGGK